MIDEMLDTEEFAGDRNRRIHKEVPFLLPVILNPRNLERDPAIPGEKHFGLGPSSV